MFHRERRSFLSFGLVAALGLGGCLDSTGAVFIEYVAAVDQESCEVQDDVRFFQGTLDIGALPEEANSYEAPLVATTNLPATVSQITIQQDRTRSPNYPSYGASDSSIIVFRFVEVYFTDDRGEPLPVAGVTPEAPRRTQLGAAVYNLQATLGNKASLLATLLTRAEARSLQLLDNQQLAGLGDLAALANDPQNRFRLNANVRVLGETTGGAEIVSQEFSFPIELCQRCLARVGMAPGQTECPPGQVLLVNPVCSPGQDVPTSICTVPVVAD